MKHSVSRNSIITWFGRLGLIAIIAATASIVAAMTFNSVRNVSSAESFITAFGGAFFAYIFVKIGELTTRLSKREKLNLDTLVECEYILNDHLNRINTNINILNALIEIVKVKSPVVNYMKFKAVPIDKSILQNMKNLDFINDMFNYCVDLEKINEGLSLISDYAIKIVNDNANLALSQFPSGVAEHAYQMNVEALESMAEESKSLLVEAEKNCVELIAKSRYVGEKRNIWLSLAYSGKVGGHYGDDLKSRLAVLVTEIEASRNKELVKKKPIRH